MAEWIIEAGPEPGARRIVKDGVDITSELAALTLVIDRTEVLVTATYLAGEVFVQADDEDPPISGTDPHGTVGEPDYEQIIEDRAAARGPDPEAVMWGGEDLPS